MPAEQAARLLLRRELIRASQDHSAVDVGMVLNAIFDALPRVEIRWSGRPKPAFRTCGTIGFALALIVAVSATLLGNRSMPALAVAIGVSVLSFFAWARLRRAITGVERLVLLEHVWIALLTVAATLALSGLPVRATLDPLCAGLAFFLAGGRAGCLLVGCCHGHPSVIGIRYPEPHVKEGFARYLTGVRLFPVQLLEFLGLLIIGGTTFILVIAAQPGTPLIWYLFSYAILRFALEELRGDERPHILCMSVPRWMCLAELVFTLALIQPTGWLPMVVVATGLALHLGRDRDRGLLAPHHVIELRSLLGAFRARGSGPIGPVAWSTSRRVTLAISETAPVNAQEPLHLSLCLPSRHENLSLVCQLAAEAFPALDTSRAIFGGNNTLHFLIPGRESPMPAHPRAVYELLYRTLLLRPAPEPTPAPPAPPVRPLVPWYWRRTN